MYNEPEFIKLIFFLADAQSWLNNLCKDAFLQLPVSDKKKLAAKTYYLTATAMAHILEKHYYKINRHPGTGKFTIPVTAIVECIRNAAAVPALPQNGSLNLLRQYNAGEEIGFDKEGNCTSVISVITDAGGKIITAFPGAYETYTNP